MLKRFTTLMGIAVLTLSFAACHNKRVSNPIAQVDSKQPDKILFDRAMDAMKRNKFDVARLTLQTLINTYPDSEYVARAKLAIGDSWYAEGGTAAMVQAENEYKDFQTFFPNMPEAAEAQLKIANIHYREMEKPDRDFTHALRAEEEYRNLITQYPDSKLVPKAKERLLEVQEVLAEREFRVSKFYYMRQSYAAAMARLKSLIETYPLYSGIDEALYMLGDVYQQEADRYRNVPACTAETTKNRTACMPEALKGRMIKQNEDKAAEAYDKILTRYPVMARAEDAKKALEAMHRPVPQATPEAIALNKKEEDSRGEMGRFGRIMANLHKGPIVTTTEAVKVGEPTLTDPQPLGAPDVIRETNESLAKAVADMNGGDGKVSVEQVKSGTPGPNQPIPRSDSGEATDNSGVPELKPIQSADDSANSTPAASTPPTQVNEIGKPSSTENGGNEASSSSSSQPAQSTDKKDYSTSKKKEKKGLRKIIPF